MIAPYTPQSNRVSKRKNRTLMDMINSMLINSDVLENLWEEALMATYYILNRIPFKNSNKTAYTI